MSTNNKALPVNEESHNKPVQEDKPSGQQRPMGNESDIKKREKDIKENLENDNDTNSVGIKK